VAEIALSDKVWWLKGKMTVTPTSSTETDPYAALRFPEFRYWMVANAFATLAGRALAVALGYQIYQLTHTPLALGMLGLVEAIPALSLALFGGHAADRYDRRFIVLTTRAVSVLAAVGLALISLNPQTLGLVALYLVVFIAGLARGFGDPAASAFETQIVSRELYVNAATWGGSIWQVTSIVGPTLGGLSCAWLGITNTYLLIAGFLAIAWVCAAIVKSKPMPPPPEESGKQESIWQSIALGVRYVFQQPVLVGGMALDLFAVLFGGAVALLPIFASDILKVGPTGLGLLTAAPSVGALVSMLWATRYPPVKHAGKILLGVVAGFGISIIVFALSENFYLSFLALMASGLFDGVSVVIRETMLRLLSPEHLRGRIAAVSWIFIGSSNEIGAFESGVAANWLGTVPAVWMGGLVTLAVVGITALAAPQLRALNLDPQQQPQQAKMET
jgi:MFS family permease